MNLLQLRYFQCAAKHQNFTKASQELFVSQPALSQMVRQLEQELRVDLFDRVGKKIQLSKAGEIYLRHVNQALSSLDAGEEALNALAGKRQVTISFGYSSKRALIQQILLECWKEHPEYVIRAERISPDCAVQRLINSEIDFALLNQKIEHPNISYRAIGRQNLYLYLGYKHPLSNIKQISLLDLKDTPILCNSHTISPESLRVLCGDYGLEPDIRIVTNDIQAIQHIMNSSPYGYFVRSNSIVRDSIETYKTKGSFHLIRQKLTTPSYLAVRNNFQISWELDQFLNRLRTAEAEYDARADEIAMHYMQEHYG